MNTLELAQKLRGIATIPAIQEVLGVDRAQAIYLVHRLRKRGYVRTRYKSNKERVYDIDTLNAMGGISYVDILNKNSPFKIATWNIHRVYGKLPTSEETLLYALRQESVRFVLASLALFGKIRSWSLLYRLAKKENKVCEIAALYEVARLVVPKVRRMPTRFRNLALRAKKRGWKYIVKDIESRDFGEIERKWRIHIPLNWADLNDYRFEYLYQKKKRGPEEMS